jgi:hypothetical protein
VTSYLDDPVTCIPSKAKMKMKRKRRKRSDKMDEMAFIRATTRFRSEDQYLRRKNIVIYGVIIITPIVSLDSLNIKNKDQLLQTNQAKGFHKFTSEAIMVSNMFNTVAGSIF